MISILFEFLTNSFVISTIGSILVTFLWLSLAEEKRKGKILKCISGPPRTPFFGNAVDLAIREEFISKLTSWYKTYGPRYLIKLGSTWRIVLANSKDLEIILKSQTEVTKSVEYERIVRWLGFGLLTSTGERWSKRRKMLTPTFHFKILEEFLDVFTSQSDALVDILRKECCNGQSFDISPFICRCALDIICETAMGTKVDAQTDRNSPYIRAIGRMSALQVYRSTRPWLFPELLWLISPSGREETRLLKIIHGFTKKVIKERKHELESASTQESSVEGKRKLAFLDLLIEAQKNPANNLSDEDIREETDTFMFEGHDTTAASVNFTIFLLAAHPEIQKKVQLELDEIFQGDFTRPITNQDLSQMKYLECCLKESLRIYPSVLMVARALQNDMKFDDNLTAPKGTILVISPYLLHRDEKVFPEPEKFIPERFLPENANGRDPFAYLPFVAGPRNCIGQKFAMMELKILTANLFRHFNFKATERQEDLVLLPDLIIRPLSGINVNLTPRV